MPWPTYATMKVRTCSGCGVRCPTRYGVCNDCYDLPAHMRPNAVARRRSHYQTHRPDQRVPDEELTRARPPRDTLVCGCDYMLATLDEKGHPASECPNPKWVRV